MMNQEEKQLSKNCLRMALEAGADKARISFSKNTMNIVASLDGAIDKVTACLDRSISISIFADGRYGTFSTNKLDEASLRDFIGRAIDTTRMLAPDAARDLPAPERTAKDAVTGNELGIYDPAWGSLTPGQRIGFAVNNSISAGVPHSCKDKGWTLVSEEGEYSDSESFNYVIDSGGTEALHSETSFEFYTEVTIQDSRGNKFSGAWWEAAPKLKDFHPETVAPLALDEAVKQIGPKSCRSGKYRMIIDSEVSSKVLNPILAALNAFSIQQKNSFLDGSLGKHLFPAGLDIMDLPRIKGESCGKFFDSEGVATSNHYIIKDGVVQEYFVNTYMANKLGIAPTIEDATRPYIHTFLGETLRTGAIEIPPKNGFDRQSLLALCRNGILVTDFCGGNCNGATGDFSYAIQGFRFKNGKIVHPVREMLITGNILTLWSHLLAAGDDARRCREKLTPSLAFDEVDFSG